jgi:hypothetical protein
MTLFHDLTVSQVRAQAAHLIALGVTVCLKDAEPPFEQAESFEDGCTVRLGVNTSGYFTATIEGVRVKWSFNLEGWGANGTGELQPRIEECRRVVQRLQGPAKDQFRQWLADVAGKVGKDAAEWRASADSYAAKAAILADLATT